MFKTESFNHWPSKRVNTQKWRFLCGPMCSSWTHGQPYGSRTFWDHGTFWSSWVLLREYGIWILPKENWWKLSCSISREVLCVSMPWNIWVFWPSVTRFSNPRGSNKWASHSLHQQFHPHKSRTTKENQCWTSFSTESHIYMIMFYIYISCYMMLYAKFIQSYWYVFKVQLWWSLIIKSEKTYPLVMQHCYRKWLYIFNGKSHYR